MGIYFRDILLIRISRGANNCVQQSLEKNIYFIMRFSPHFQLFYFNDRLEFCEFIEWKIKRINNADLFSQPTLLIFIKGANISGGHCIYIFILWWNQVVLKEMISSCCLKIDRDPAFRVGVGRSLLVSHIYSFVYCICVYIYIYIERERELLSFSNTYWTF